ncbi:Rieske 2Fe-2S domain-containing protein [Actibacterium sp.]|uniref:Rieske 2Fe-2S domain-containing protein n=1 Tax=Actibacterium sp. TaxID=1872125 RepID=UPI003562F289
MATTKEDNDLMTLVEGEAPLGQMLRQHYWLPAIPGEKLESDGRPYRVRLLGENYVVFRNTDGDVGILDELCPHRRASLALGQNRENGLRCIYHGWKFDIEGNLVDAPNVENNQEQFCKSVKVNRYRAVERGGIIWVWLGKGTEAPAFPALPFVDLPPEQRSVTSAEVKTNWLQGVEASMDTTHVSFLHSSTVELGGNTQRKNMTKARSAKLEFQDRPYGFRYAAIRDIGSDKSYVRVNNFVMPWYAVICPPEENGPSTVFFSVPVDDTTHRAWFVHFNQFRPLGLTPLSMTSDSWNWPPNPPGSPDENWGQNREVMARGHFSGFPQHLATEDFAMFLSQGPVHDRTKEQLCSSDGALLRVRHQILKSVKEYSAGETPKLAESTEEDYTTAVSVGMETDKGAAWKTLVK